MGCSITELHALLDEKEGRLMSQDSPSCQIRNYKKHIHVKYNLLQQPSRVLTAQMFKSWRNLCCQNLTIQQENLHKIKLSIKALWESVTNSTSSPSPYEESEITSRVHGTSESAEIHGTMVQMQSLSTNNTPGST